MRLPSAAAICRSFGPRFTRLYSSSPSPAALPKESDVVIIGGGAIGLSVFYHLVKHGCKRVVLLERDKLTSGSSWHAAGIQWLHRGSESETLLSQRTRSLITELKDEHEIETDYIGSGSLMVASKPERWTEYLKMVSVASTLGVKAEILSPSDVKKMYPIMDVNDLQGAIYTPDDGNINPASYCDAMAKIGKKQGGQIFTRCRVESISTIIDQCGAKRVTGVTTSLGHINTKTVVNCAGLWSNYVSHLVGTSLPLMPIKHTYIQTETVRGARNLPNLRDQDSSFYIRSVGDCLIIGGYESNPEIWDEVEHHDFSFSLFEFNPETFDVTMKGAIRRVPSIANVGIKAHICGPESFSVDSRPVLGESPDVRGFWVASGLSSSGMMLSGGVGEQVAKWILNGRPDYNLYKYDVRRFPKWLVDRPGWIRERIHETLANKYSLKWPFDEPKAGRNVILDPLYDRQLKSGAVFQQQGGYERPAFFTPELGTAVVPPYDFYGAYGNPPNKGTYWNRNKLEYSWSHPPASFKYIVPELQACRESVGIINMNSNAQFYLFGPEATKAADYIFSADVSQDQDNGHDRVHHSCILSNQGKIVNDLIVCRVDAAHCLPLQPKFSGSDAYYISTSGHTMQLSYSWIRDRLHDGGFKAWLVDYTPHLGILSVQGPNSRRLLMEAISDANLSDSKFPYMTHKLMKISGHLVRVLRVSNVGELGWEIHAPVSALPKIHTQLLKMGRGLGIREVGFRAVHLLGLEAGCKNWGEDITLDDTPLEAGIDSAVKLGSEKDFLGRQALEQQNTEGLKRRLVHFAIPHIVPEEIALHGHEPIFRDGEFVGPIRRAGYSPSTKRFVAVGYVRNGNGVATPEWIQSGKYELEVEPGKRIPATAQLKPFFDPEGDHVNGIYH